MPLAGFPSVLSHWRLDDMNGIKQHGKMFHKQQQQVAHIRPLPAAVAQHRLCSNQSISPTCWAHSSKLAAARVMLSAHAGTDRQMDRHHNIKFIVHRPSCAYYVDTVPINWLLLQHSAGWHRKNEHWRDILQWKGRKYRHGCCTDKAHIFHQPTCCQHVGSLLHSSIT